MAAAQACDRCLRRAWLLSRLGGHLEQARGRIACALSLSDDELISALGGRRAESIREELGFLDVDQLRRRCDGAGLESICRCDSAYPAQLRALPSAPATLHVAGGLSRLLTLAGGDSVAIVGTRDPSSYGLEVARGLGRALARTGVTVLSGMARGIDAAVHRGALSGPGSTVAVLPGSADRPYPASSRALHRGISATGAIVSELPPGAPVWRWAFPARNRIIAGLATITVVVEAGVRSGALLTAAFARELGRNVGAVPGRVTSRQATGANALLASGAQVIRDAQDVLDLLFGANTVALRDDRPSLDDELRRLLTAISDGHDTAAALARAGFPAEQALAGLASLELAGYIRRGSGGRFVALP